MPYVKYYTNQSGGGIADIGAIYKTPLVIQRGRGIGDVFSGLGRYLRPMFISGLSALKDQALTTGKNVIRDIWNQKPLNDILKDQTIDAMQGLADKAVNKVKRKMQGGSGRRKSIKRQTKMPALHLRKRRKTQHNNRDIFN